MAFYFPRPELAKHFGEILSDHPVKGTASGLFLSAPRRTGKSSFLRQDLRPLLEKRGDHVIYVDLWSDRTAEPAALLAQALAESLAACASRMSKLWSNLPFKSIKVAGVQVALDKSGGSGTGTLSDALTQIGDAVKANVVLIIDEAQDLYDSAPGKAALSALKAARDAMNQRPSGSPRLYLLFTGSNRDKLSNLVTKQDQAFFGASVTKFPVLGNDYITALVAQMNPHLAADNQLDVEDVTTAFALVSHRPELLDDLVRKAATSAPGLTETVTHHADALRALIWDEYKRQYDALTPLQQAMLRLLVQEGAAFQPYAEETLASLSDLLDTPVKKAACQRAMKALRDDGIIWQQARGIYATEERDFATWISEQFEPLNFSEE